MFILGGIMAIIVEKRTRATVNDAWSAWSNTTVDSVTDGTFTSTDLVQYRTGYTAQLSDLTNATEVDAQGINNGTGVFDALMNIVTRHITADFTTKKLTTSDYAQVREGSIAAILAQAVQFTMQKPLIDKQVESEIAKTLLVERQTKGFDDDAKQKLLKQALDSWAVAYTVAKDANAIPDSIKVNPIDSIMKNAMDSLAIVNSNNPLGEA